MRRHPWILRLGLLSALLIPAMFFAGCGGGSSSNHTQLTASELSSAQEVGGAAFTSPASGSLTVTINQQPTTLGIRGATTFAVNLQTVGLDPTTVTGVAIYNANAGTNGPAIFTLFNQSVSGVMNTPLTETLSVKNYTQPSGSSMTYDQAINALESGTTYVNVLTYAHPNGEIRGAIGPVTLQATLSNPSTNAAGTALFQLNNTQTAINVTLNAQALPINITEVDIRLGAPGTANGPIIFPFFSDPSGGILSTPLTAQITPTDFVIPSSSTGVASFADATNALLSGNMYLAIESVGNSQGLIRGQILPTP